MSIQYASISSLLASPFQRLTSAMWNTAVLTLSEIYFGGSLIDRQLFQNGNLYVPNNITAQVGNFSEAVYVAGQPVITEEDPIYIAGFVGSAIQQIQAILNSQLQLYEAIVQMPYDVYSAISKLTAGTVTQTQSALQQEIANVYQTLYQVVIGVDNQLKTVISPVLYLPQLIQNVYENIYLVSAKLTNQIVIGLSNAIYSVADALLYALAYVYLAMNSLTNAINKLTLYMSPPAIQGLQLSISTTPQPIYAGPAIETVKIILQNLSNYIVYIGNQLYNNFPILPGDILEFSVNNPSNVYAWATGPCTVYALFETL
ncbi:hypothetical protein QIT30_gp14 [Saccharolobus solfataricus rod-shaped virus 1]|uniref:Uncharacterized protein n=1 Tax=Saccharolobus solfataricus rod-shaped virus 1 TaxID=2730619 RepID=A0A6M3VYM5_SSRV1|nr:hypothetical protein QIT30_gp14 [Saccharolobus solfataricus rod-shaped virus 1]QJF12290.1 hypothetical protein SSRV1_gp14 [Saccharolobus solfataricus rod-shaped virus 1]